MSLKNQLDNIEKQQSFIHKCLEFVDLSCKEYNTLLFMLTKQESVNPVFRKKRPGCPSFAQAKAALYLGQDDITNILLDDPKSADEVKKEDQDAPETNSFMVETIENEDTSENIPCNMWRLLNPVQLHKDDFHNSFFQ